MEYESKLNKDIDLNECKNCLAQRQRYESDIEALKERVTEVVSILVFCSVKTVCRVVFYDTSRKHKKLIKRAFKELWGV